MQVPITGILCMFGRTFPAPTGPTMAIILAFWPQLNDTFFKVSLPPFFTQTETQTMTH